MKATILLAEDEQAMREVLIDYFTAKSGGDFTVVPAPDGDTALHLIETRRFDLLLLDIKLIDDKAHRELTGCTNENILDLARYLDEIGKPVWIRHVLVPERSAYDEYLIRLDEFLHSLHNVQRVEVLPYHTLGVFKWETLGIPYKLEGINPPTKERVENANKLLHTAEYTGYLK